MGLDSGQSFLLPGCPSQNHAGKFFMIAKID